MTTNETERPRRILIFHGYLLRGTGSNVYNANLARVLVRLGHEVHLFSQEHHPEDFDFVDTMADYEGDQVHVRLQRNPRFAGRCTVYRPDIGGLLPVYVHDRYEGFKVRTFPELTDQELDRYISANVAAVRGVVASAAPQIALANHAIMGPLILHRALGDSAPYAVKIHGSALEYTVKPHPRFLPYAREGILGARTVLVGSENVAARLFAILNEPSLVARTRLGPPGVDVEAFTPRDQETNVAALHRLVERLATVERTGFSSSATKQLNILAEHGVPEWPELLAIQQQYDPAGIDERSPSNVAKLDPMGGPIVAFIGKLIISKGIDLLICAWPFVRARQPQAKLMIIGFGNYRECLELLLRALERGDLTAIRQIARRGRALEGGPIDRLAYVEAFLDGLVGLERDAYLHTTHDIRRSVIFTGRLDHEYLVDLLPAADVLVVPSTFPEAFGMVAAEAAASGTWPIVAAHSGLAEVAQALSEAVPAEHRTLLSFTVGPNAVREIADRLNTWLAIPAAERERLTTAARRVAVERWSWEGVAHTMLAACDGRLDELPVP